MIILKYLEDDILVASENKLILHKRVEQSNTIIDVRAVLKEIANENGCKKHVRIICLAISKDAKYLAFCTDQKQIIVLSSELNIFKTYNSARVASQITFTPPGLGLIIADRTGDVYLYQLDREIEKPVLLLGHLSVVTDVQVSDCGKYIITSDRDEKIRVSYVPNAYNIVNFCLGHEEFVSCIKVCGDYLISSSGDGTIRFWEYKEGTLINTINTNEQVEKEIISNFITELNSKDIEGKAVPVTEIQFFIKEDHLFLAASLYQYPNLLLYTVKNNTFDVISVNIINVSNIFSFVLSEKLLILNENNVLSYTLRDSTYEVSTNTISEEVVEDIISNVKFKSNDHILSFYKKKFDNVQDYLEKKKIRLDQK